MVWDIMVSLPTSSYFWIPIQIGDLRLMTYAYKYFDG